MREHEAAFHVTTDNGDRLVLRHVAWIDEYDQLWGIHLRNGVVPTDRPLYALDDEHQSGRVSGGQS